MNLDFETASRADLLAIGAHRYAMDPSTHVLLATYKFGHADQVKRWRAWETDEMPADFRAALLNPAELIHAWNGEFERLILKHVLGFDIPASRFRCTMARARSMALPGKLENTARALHFPIRKLGNAIMLKWCKPQRDGTWADDPAEYEKLCEYGDRDTDVEALADVSVREFSPEEIEDYAINADINDRGIMIDRALAIAAQRYAQDEIEVINGELTRITNGQVTTAKQFQKIKAWLQPNLPEEWRLQPDERGKISFDRRAREELLAGIDEEPDLFAPHVADFITYVDDAGRASTAKFKAMVNRADPVDDRVRGSYILNGAGQTNRFSAQGLQTQNMIRAKLPDAERVIEGILRGCTREELIALARPTEAERTNRDGVVRPAPPDMNVLSILSRLLRPSIIAPEGKKLVWGDWSAIEARVNPWLSNCATAMPLLDAFRDNVDVYIRQAQATFRCTESAVLQDIANGGDYRQTAKVQILSFGFGGGAGAMMAMARAYGIDMDPMRAEFLKHAWRASNPWGPEFWQALEIAYMSAMYARDTPFTAGLVQYMFTNGALWCVLPSGRVLCYPLAKVEVVEGRMGPAEVVTAMKASRNPKAGAREWPRMHLWGGFCCENVTQAEAASLLRWLLRELKRRLGPAFDVIGHSHDEVVREVLEEMEAEAKALLLELMTGGPPWARMGALGGLPLNAEVGSGYSYGK